MEQLIEFIGNHPFLFLAFGVVLGLLAWNLFGEQIQGIQSVPPQQATMLINHENGVVLDVREESEFSEGHILNAQHIPLGKLSDKLKQLETYRQKPIIVSCRSGNRSAQACSRLRQNGFEKVYNLKGGIIAWQNASLPLTKETKKKKKSA